MTGFIPKASNTDYDEESESVEGSSLVPSSLLSVMVSRQRKGRSYQKTKLFIGHKLCIF